MCASADQGVAFLTPDRLGLAPELQATGINLASVLTKARYDALVPAGWRSDAILPSAQSVVVLATGGSTFFRAAMATNRQPEHPLDVFCEERVEAAAARLGDEGFATRALYYWERRRLPGEEQAEARFADFVKLGQAGGLGVVGRIGLLLHPTYGPWLGIRALLVTERAWGLEPATWVAAFSPCDACSAPCVGACHGSAVSGAGVAPVAQAFSHPRCASTRERDENCASRCDARLACPVGAENRYSAEALEYHMTARLRGGSDR